MKEFDCVKMKYLLQERLLQKRQGLSEDEADARFEREIESSDDVLARWWRKVRGERAATSTANKGR